MADDVRELVRALITESPKFHDWGKGLQSGGLEGPILQMLAQYIQALPADWRSLETGSGLSTMLFLAHCPQSHIVVNPDAPVRDRIFAEAEARGIDVSSMRYIVDFSEYVLPELSKTSPPIDIGLIDGGHGWPTVFVDFCYVNIMLKSSGILVVDDVMLFPCSELYLLLKHQPGWKLEKVVGQKTAFFRKQNDRKLLPDFGGCPYLRNNQLFGPLSS